jgi:iron-sulfur cluster repair protein YtfE (RIC family)
VTSGLPAHANWSKRAQMPAYRVHFRQEMQQLCRYLKDAYYSYTNATDTNSNKATTRTTTAIIRRAQSMFAGSMKGLSGHVQIEEQALFPIFKRRHATVDTSFLYDDHKHLHTLERVAQSHFHQLQLLLLTRQQQPPQVNSSGGLLLEQEATLLLLEATLLHVLAFDDALMNHLGEEEEVLVPLTLSTDYLPF